MAKLKWGTAREHITGMWWVIKETGMRWPNPQVRKISGPYPTLEEAEAMLPKFIDRKTASTADASLLSAI